MAFDVITFDDDQEVTPDELNQLQTNETFLRDRLLPMLKAACAAQTDYGFYIADFPSLIDPNQASGSGSNGAAWSRLWLNGNHMGLAITWPAGIFSAAPFILGATIGSADQWGLITQGHWKETATGYYTAVRDSGGESYPVNTLFRYTALLLGPRAADPT